MESDSRQGPYDRGQKLRDAVDRVMSIEDVTVGGPSQDYRVRFRGRLMVESQDAYEILEPVFRAEGQTLLFREEDGRHAVIGIQGVIEPEPSNPWVNLGLFLLTLLSVIFAGAVFANVNFYGNEVSSFGIDSVQEVLELVLGGVPFALALLGILVAHEFGHYLAGRYHNTAVTLPYFLPFPGSILGTLGAFIRMKEPPRNRRVLLDIGVAGPLAGFVVAVPILFVGLTLSELSTLPSGPAQAQGLTLEGNSILYLFAKYLVKGELLPAPAGYGGVSPVAYWLRYFFLGEPVPYGGVDVLVHPLAWAGWAGLLVTALNLIPAGQLDGGHLTYTLFGPKVSRFWPVIVLALAAFGFVWPGWWIWAALIFFLGRNHAEPLDTITPLDSKRRLVAGIGLLIFVLTFSPVPLSTFGV